MIEPRRLLKGLSTIVLLALIPLTLSGCGSAKKENSQASDKSAELGANLVPIEVADVKRSDLAVMKTFSGTLEGEEQANIVAKIPERVTDVKVRVGEPVRSGRLIVALDKSGTSSQYYQAEAGFRNAKKTLERMKSLYDEGAVSLETLDGAQTAHDVAKANFDAARSAVELSTPISGVVTAINVSKGDLAQVGSVLATVANINRMKVIFNIDETDVASLSVGHKIQVHSEVRPDVKIEGRVIQLSKSADVQSRSFEIKAVFSNTSDRLFKPGMFCKVDVQFSPRTRTLVVPNGAIQSDGVANRVFVVRNNRSFQRTVQTGITDGENTEILAGLAENDTVATIGVNNLRDSSFVCVVNASHDQGKTTR